MAGCEIVNRADGAIFIGDRDGDRVGGLPHRLNVFRGTAGQESQEIDEMTGFAENAAAAQLGVLSPVFSGDGAGIDRVHEGFRLLHALEQLTDADYMRSKPPVKPDHQDTDRKSTRPE